MTARPAARVAALFAVLAAGRAAGAADAPRSPAFGQRSFHVLHVPFLDFDPADPASPAPGHVAFRFEAAYATTFSSTWHALTVHKGFGRVGRPFGADEAATIHADFPDDRVFFLQSDLLRLAGTARAGLTPTLSVSAEIVWISHDAVHGGSAVEAFHRAFGLDQSGRNEFPASAFAIAVQRPGRAMFFDDRVPDDGFGDTTATLSWRPTRASAWSYGVDAAVKTPTGSARNLNGSGSWDAGGLAFARRDGRKWAIDGEAGFVVPGRWRGGPELPVALFSRFLLGATRSFGARTRVGVSATYEQSPFRRDALGDLSHSGLEIALGVERDLSAGSSAALTITENVPSLGDRADFGLALRLRLR